jgi:hypothetical protein
VGLARADDADPIAAKALFYDARRLAGAGHYDEACPKFEESQRLSPGIGTLFNLADCLQHLGRTASAWTRFLDVASLAHAAQQPDREQVARQRAAALEPVLSRVTIEVPVVPPGLLVRRDGLAVHPSLWGTAVPLDPGPHTVDAAAPSIKSYETRVDVLPGGARVSVTIPVVQLVLTSPAPRAPPTETSVILSRRETPSASVPPDKVERGSRMLRIAGFITAGSGIAALTVGTVFGILTSRDDGEARALCPTFDPTTGSYECAARADVARHDQLVRDAKQERTVAIIGIAGGSVALVGGTVMLWSTRARPRGATAVPSVSVGVLMMKALGFGLAGAF